MELLAGHPVLAMMIFLGILIFVHELGHYLVGRACGIGVEIFSVGFGPRLIGFHSNGTDYRISGLPFGGYVKFAGAVASEPVPEVFRGREMYKSSVMARAATILAGPMANILLACGIYAWLGLQGITHPAPEIGSVIAGKPADVAGFQPGDYILKIDGLDILTREDFRHVVSKNPGIPLDVLVRRITGDQQLLKVTPESYTDDLPGQPAQSVGRIGVGFGTLPSVLTVFKHEKMRTGDRVNQLSFAGQQIQVENWYQMVAGFERAYEARVDKIYIGLVDAEKVEVDLRSWYLSQARIDGIESAVEKRKVLAGLLGLHHSQLTVANAQSSEPEQQAVEAPLQPFKFGDRLTSFDGHDIADIYQLSSFLMKNQSEQVEIGYLRDGVEQLASVDLEPITVQRVEGKATFYKLNLEFLGQLEPSPTIIEKYSTFSEALLFGVMETKEKAVAIGTGLVQLMTGNLPLKALGGPVLIAKIAGDAAEAGLVAFLGTMAIISINLGLVNLVPLPAVDGGQLCVVAVEALRRKPLSDESMEQIQRLGFMVILALMILATYNDVSRFWTGIFSSMVK